MRSVIAALLLVGTAFGAENDQAPITLVPTTSRLLDVAGFPAWGPAQCDLDGNLYFHTGRVLNDLVFLKLGADNTHEVYVANSSPDGTAEYFSAFRVTPDGKLWVLAGGKKDSIFLLEFTDDPTTPTRTKLDAPGQFDALTVNNFVVLQNGHVRVYGVLGEKAPKREQGHRYTLEFDASGKLLRKTVDKDSDSSSGEGRYKDASAAQSNDGTIYLLAEDKVLVISQTGQLLRKIKLRLPEPEFEAHALYVAGRRVAVGFSKRNPDGHTLTMRYALIDGSNGEQLRLYQGGPETGNNMVCFSNDGFTFFRVEKGRVKLVMAAAN
jgi:hypothetical protein